MYANFGKLAVSVDRTMIAVGVDVGVVTKYLQSVQ